MKDVKDPALSTTIAICCRLPASADAGLVDDFVRTARAARLAVTWVVGPEELATTAAILSDRGESGGLALEPPGEWFSGNGSTSLARQRLAAARRLAPSLDAIVARGGDVPTRTRSELLVAHGIRIVAVERLEAPDLRRSRRPAPSGWACHCPTWGLWEVRIAPNGPVGMLGRIFPFSCAPSLPSGSLCVLRTGYLAGRSKRECRQDFDRTLHWIARRVAARRHDTACVTLSDLASFLGRGTAGAGPRSVLAA